ncbi:NAD dependent epimerase/dehydratase [Micromonospora sp. M42]|nr:NAD dependent epimerase/dehydratase [Micromonospora sp. M42]
MLGGTGFVGGAVVAEAVRRDWQVTVFNRGVHGQAPPGVHRLRGDRTMPDGLAALAGGEWDLVVDTWDGAPRAVRDAASALAGAVPHYVYVSSGSVYAPPVELGTGEEAPTVSADPDADDGDYPENKAGGELAATREFGDRALLVRAGLILGPGEDIGRLPWWLNRIARGGDVLAPGPRDLPIQYVDVRDLANWLLDRGAEGVGGAYNVIGRTGHTTMGELLDAAVAATGSDATLRWAAPEPILAAGVVPWNDLPVWVPRGARVPLVAGAERRAGVRGGAGLPAGDRDGRRTWRWLREVGQVPARAGRPARAPVGLAPEREATLLATLPA